MPSIDLQEAFREKSALITGGIGFIGSNLARCLLRIGASVTIIDNLTPEFGGNPYNIHDIEGQCRVFISDMCDEDRMEQVLPAQDFLFNLAAQVSHAGSMGDPMADLEVNAVSQIKLLELCRKWNPAVRIVYAGTRQMYGRPHYLPVDEKHSLEPLDFNGISKMAGEWYHLVCHRVYGMRTTSVRMTNVYGPRMRVRDAYKTFIGYWFRQILEDQEMTIYGDGSQMRDLNYVDDVVDALLACAANPQAVGQIYNLGAEPVSLLTLAQMLMEINGRGSYRIEPFPPEVEAIDIGDYYGDYSKIREHLAWEPSTPLREGLLHTLDYYRENHQYYWP
jgi:UDP-glucose 4-epimerase